MGVKATLLLSRYSATPFSSAKRSITIHQHQVVTLGFHRLERFGAIAGSVRVQIELAQHAADYVALAEIAGTEQRLIAYFATPAAVYGAICENLSKVGLAENTRVVLEKPIGSDRKSTRLNSSHYQQSRMPSSA